MTFAQRIIAGALLAFSSAPLAAQPARDNRALEKAIESVAARVFALNASPGAGIVVVRDSQVVYAKGFGFADVESKRPFTAETEFYIASTTKSFTGMAAAMLAREGKWNLDAPISRYLPAMKLRAPMNPDSISVRSLLTHTHGIGEGPVALRLAYTGEYHNDDELVALMAEHVVNPRGRVYSYTNLGYNVAGFAMARVTGESWKETLQRLLFTPLGMQHTSAYASKWKPEQMATGYKLTPDGFARMHFAKTDATMQSAGGLFTTPNDMGRWLLVNMNGGRLNGKQVVPADVVAEAHRAQVPMTGAARGIRNVAYGFGWEIVVAGNDTIHRHGGGFPGYATLMSFMPQQHVGVAVMANNGELGGGFVELMTSAIYDVLQGREPISADSAAAIGRQLTRSRAQFGAAIAQRAQRPQNLPQPLEAYTGRFFNPVMGTFELRLVNGKLEAHMGAVSSAIEVYDNTKDQLRVELFGNGEVVTVNVQNGRAESVSYQSRTYSRIP